MVRDVAQMKPLTAILLNVSLLLFSSVCYAGSDDIKVYINNNRINYDTMPININNRILVPVRATFDALGADIEWFGEIQTVIATSGSTLIALKIDNPLLIVSDVQTQGIKTIELDSPPVLFNSKTMIPLRAVAEIFDYQVNWSEANKSIFINKN